jgi:hypothetical protein
MKHQAAKNQTGRQRCREEAFEATLEMRLPVRDLNLSMPAVITDGGFRVLHLSPLDVEQHTR